MRAHSHTRRKSDVTSKKRPHWSRIHILYFCYLRLKKSYMYSMDHQWSLGWSIPFSVLVDPYPFNAVKRVWIDPDVIDSPHCKLKSTYYNATFMHYVPLKLKAPSIEIRTPSMDTTPWRGNGNISVGSMFSISNMAIPILCQRKDKLGVMDQNLNF